jgi:hypothetical protein
MSTRFLLVPLVVGTIVWAGCDEKGNPLLFDLPLVTSVVLTPETRTAFVGEDIQFTALLNAQGNVPNTTFTWSSSNPSVATVDGTGKATARAAGTTIIAARSNFDTSKQDTSELTVIVPIPIVFNITATKTVDTGCNFSPSFTGQLEATANSDGSNLRIQVTERLSRLYFGVLMPSGTFTSSGSGNLDGFQYTGTIAGTATANTVQGTETMNFTTGCPGKQVVYQFSGSRQ